MNNESPRASVSLAPGFTLIELLAVLSIVVIMSLVILFNTNKFDSAILLRSLAYKVGLSVREAQLFGVAVKEDKRCTTTFCAGGYGVFFCHASSCAVNGVSDVLPSTMPAGGITYPLFADINGASARMTGTEIGGVDFPIVETFKLGQHFFIKDICVTQTTTGTDLCLSQGAFSWVSISFKRPDPEATILSDRAGGEPYSKATITLASTGGGERSVTVSATGQIVVEDAAR